MRRNFLLLVTALLLGLPEIVMAQAEAVEEASLGTIVPWTLPAVSLDRAQVEDEKRQIFGQVAHFAVPVEVAISPFDLKFGEWKVIGKNAHWLFRLRSPEALSLSLAFGLYRMPEGGRLVISSVNGRERIVFTERDNENHGELWTPALLTDEVKIELILPLDPLFNDGVLDELDLELSRVHHGYAGFGEAAPLSGACQRDVACSDDPVWLDAARAVAMISVEGVRYCSGFMINNTALDGRPFFITADHCGVTAENAASVVVMWNYESASCRDPESLDPPLLRPSESFQTGAILRAAYSATDVTLLELDDLPRADWNVHYAGWDRTLAEPLGATVIHHPNTDLKRFSVDHDLTKAAFYLGRALPEGNHLRIGGWEVGSTEGGSSGAPLFNENQRVIGQLHGGYAECGEKKADWFGRFAISWDGGGELGDRLSDWLDPLGTETWTLDGLDASKLLGMEP